MELSVSLNLAGRLLWLLALILLCLCLLRVHSNEVLASVVAAFSAGAPSYSFSSVFEEEGELDAPIYRWLAAIVYEISPHDELV